MEENTTNQPTQAKNTYIIPVALLALILIIAVGFFVSQGNKPSTASETATISTPAPTVEAMEEHTSPYQDGMYEVIGNYVSPGGPREIDVTITLANGVITDTTFVGKATDATSKRFQGEFGDNYKVMVVGKNIDEVALTKVSGSSLTPKGFADALKKVKTEAKQSG